jgi:hypothetical protein
MQISLAMEVTVNPRVPIRADGWSPPSATTFDMSLVIVSLVVGGACAILFGVALWMVRHLVRRLEKAAAIDAMPWVNSPSRTSVRGNVGPYRTDPGAGAYCEITLANGEKIIVSHDKGPGCAGGRLTIEQSKLFGFNTQMIFSCDLDSAYGKAALEYISLDDSGAPARIAPLVAFVRHVKDCASVADVRRICSGLIHD